MKLEPWMQHQPVLMSVTCCALCESPASCSRYDGYASYVGALRCLVETDADVAFIKKETVLENTDGNNPDSWASGLKSEDFEILCKDGTRRAITEDADCHLAPSPSHAVVTSSSKSDEDITSYVSLLERAVELFGVDGNSNGFSLFDSATWSEADLLFKDTTETLGALNSDSYQEFLGEEYIESLDGLMACPDGTLRFCTISDGEQEKCLAMMDNFSMVNISPTLSCFPASSHLDCMIAIADGNADLVTLDGGDIYQAGKKYGLVPVMGEDYGTGDASYWAVAVVKSDTSFTINDLKGKKSCHTGIMKTSGWIVPVGFLVENGHLTIENCDGAAAVGEYFEQSCAPGALSEKYNPYSTNPESLCDLCVGEGDDNCVRNDHEPYYDYSGAFRCLVEGAGDVAFVKQVTVDDNINPSNPAEWNENLSKSDYSFLCPDGSRQQDWTMECSLGKVSSHALMTSAEKTQGEIEEIIAVFTAGQNRYGSDTGDDFKLFDSQDYEGSDLLFKDSTNTLQDVGNKDTYDNGSAKSTSTDWKAWTRSL
ncbi:melanotransferrin [Apostichopus japonicus]|uniref:Melanotransferrin n=1 Tax=Stichopus japonicus TaxID=307972 RepID=A0A2G8LHM3_STIJA|nr:melanotransferrin [Apostichopus japonicus]